MGTDVKHTANKTVLQKHQAISKGTPATQAPQYPFSWLPGGYNCWWVTDKILRRAMKDLRCNDPEFRRREEEYWKTRNRFESRRRVGGGL